MLYQTLQVAEDRHKEMLVEAEKYRMLAEISQHEPGPVRRILTFAGQTLIAIGEALRPPALKSDSEPRVWTDS